MCQTKISSASPKKTDTKKSNVQHSGVTITEAVYSLDRCEATTTDFIEAVKCKF